jgi:hypothetical protein
MIMEKVQKLVSEEEKKVMMAQIMVTAVGQIMVTKEEWQMMTLKMVKKEEAQRITPLPSNSAYMQL